MAFDFADAAFRVGELARFDPGPRRGAALEELVTEMLSTVPGVEVCEPNALSAGGDEEIDRLIVNDRAEDGLRFLPQDILVECKSQEGPVEAPQVRDFSMKLLERNMELGILVTAAGLTGGQGHRAGDLASEKSALRGSRILVVWTAELARMRSAQHLAALLETKRRKVVSGWLTRELSAAEIREMNPERREGRAGFRYGWQSVAQAIAEMRRTALLEMLDRAGPGPEDFAEAIAELHDRLATIAHECVRRRADPTLDPLWHEVRDLVVEFGAAAAALRVPGPHDADAQRVIRNEVERMSLGALRPWVGSELWEFLTNYFVRQLEKEPDVFRTDSIAALLDLCVESINTIDDIDPADVYDLEDVAEVDAS